MQSPIVTHGMREAKPHAPDPRSGLVVFNIRAYDFWNHPYFLQQVGSCPLRLVFESLAFRFRPIALIDSDDASLWCALRRLEGATGAAGQCADFKERYDTWFSITDDDLQAVWPIGVQWSADPPPGTIPEDWNYRPTPVQALWDRVFGDGPHSDFRRVLANKTVDWNQGARLNSDWHAARMIAVMSALRPLIIDVHNAVLQVTSQPTR